jgi:hypothetical protein
MPGLSLSLCPFVCTFVWRKKYCFYYYSPVWCDEACYLIQLLNITNSISRSLNFDLWSWQHLGENLDGLFLL